MNIEQLNYLGIILFFLAFGNIAWVACAAERLSTVRRRRYGSRAGSMTSLVFAVLCLIGCFVGGFAIVTAQSHLQDPSVLLVPPTEYQR